MTTRAPKKAPSKALAQTPGGDGRLSLSSDQTWWTEAQRGALAAAGLANVPDGDLVAFLHLCQTTGLDPFRREVYLIGRKDSKAPSGTKWTAQTGIDGFRHIAERTGKYGGKVMTEWCGPDGEWKQMWLDPAVPPAAARVTIARTDLAHPVYGVAMYHEFVPMQDVWENNRKTGEQKPGGLWGKMPAHMLAKCAEALAIRTAFPRGAGGVYIAEEMHQADVVAENERAAEAATARAEARRAGASRPWAKDEPTLTVVDEQGRVISSEDPDLDPATAPDPDEPVDAVVVEDQPGPVAPTPGALDRDTLLGLLDEQAEALGMSRTQFVNRWVRSHRKNIEDATPEELAALIDSRRDLVDEALAAKARQQAEAPAPAPAPPAAQAPVVHRYAEDLDAKDGSCKHCGKEWDDRSQHPAPDDDLVPDL